MESRPIVTVFRSRLRDEAADEYADVAQSMASLARAMPGFVDFKTFEAGDGERVSIIVFDSLDSHEAWRDHPQHREAQQLGRARYYEEYRILVCEQLHERSFSHSGS